jgi:hypothetical protein
MRGKPEEIFTRPAPAAEADAWRAHCLAMRAYDRAKAEQEAIDRPLLKRLKARITRRLNRDKTDVIVLPNDLHLGWSTNHVEMTQDLYLRCLLTSRKRGFGCRFALIVEGTFKSMAELDHILAEASRRMRQ